MKVIDAFPPHRPGKRPRCEGTLAPVTIEFNEARERNRVVDRRRARLGLKHDECGAWARYRIGDRWLCRKHAAYVLLDSLATPEGA